jgi:hypothetical protein
MSLELSGSSTEMLKYVASGDSAPPSHPIDHRPSSNNSRKDYRSGFIYAAISLVFLVAALVSGWLLARGNAFSQAYYIALVILALSSSICLFGIIESYANFTGSLFGGALKLSGPAVVAAGVVLGGFFLPSSAEDFTLTVRFRGSSLEACRTFHGRAQFG